MKYLIAIFIIATTGSSCSTLNESFRLGASVGSVTGAAATYAGYIGTGNSPPLERIALGTGVGLGLGLLTSYLIHRDVEEKRQSSDLSKTEMYFGDLPPSPFIMPSKRIPNKGDQR